MNYASSASSDLRHSSLLHLLLHLLLLSIPCSSIDPAGNSAVPACRALGESLGPQALTQCHVMLSPTYFGYSTSVAVSIDVRTIYGLGDSELMEWSGWILMTWTDPRLAWNATATGTEQLRIERSSLWLPDIGYWNAKESELFDWRNSKFLETVASPDGTVYVYVYTVSQLPCALDMRLFPFDQQICTLEVGTLTSDSSVFNFSLSSHISSSEDGSVFYGVGEWTLEALTQRMLYERDVGRAFQYYNLRFHLQRRVTYYASLMIVPYELLSLLASIMFFAEQQGDRANVSIAIIMSMTLYVLIASQSAPKSMNVIPLIGIFLIAQMLILICFTFVAIVRPELQTQVPTDSDEVEKASSVRRLLRAAKARCIRHKDGLCFIGYISVSALNAIVFLLIWPAVSRDPNWKS